MLPTAGGGGLEGNPARFSPSVSAIGAEATPPSVWRSARFTDSNIVQAMLLHELEDMQEDCSEEVEEEREQDSFNQSCRQDLEEEPVAASASSRLRLPDSSGWHTSLRSTLRSTLGRDTRATLQDMRRIGPLRGLSTEGYATFMGSTLFEYGRSGEAPSFSSETVRPLEGFQDMAETLRQLRAAVLGLSAEDDTSSASRSPFNSSSRRPLTLSPARSRPLRVSPGASPPGASQTGGSESFWQSGDTAFGGTVMSTTSSFDASIGSMGGDGQETFEMHAVLRRMYQDGDTVAESLAEQAVQRMVQLGSVAEGRRLSEEEIEALPKITFDDEEQQICAICLEAYQPGVLLTALSCQHFFHVACLARWFQRSTQCPLCRSSQCAEEGESGD